MCKLALGTVQFGLNYGISNTSGKIPHSEIIRILKFAFDNGIDTLDTAVSYGNSEIEIGESVKELNYNFKIISKIGHCSEDIFAVFNQSLKRLNASKIYGYILHDFNYFLQKPVIYDELNELKNRGLIQKVGFSLYKPAELDFLLQHNISFDIIQLPYNILDQRFSNYFQILKERGIEIYIRSVFLQGLILMNTDEINFRFSKVIDKIKKIHHIAKEFNITVTSLCLGFVFTNQYIDKAIIGVDGLSELKENIKDLLNIGLVNKIYPELLELKENNENIILPYNWK